MNEFWKWIAAILAGAVGAMAGFWLVHGSTLVTRNEAELIAKRAVGNGPSYDQDKRYFDEAITRLSVQFDKGNEALQVMNSRVGQVEAKLDILIGQGARRASAEVGP